jgi:hypothetical protein
MGNKISELGVTVGYACNFKCAHCGVSEKKHLRLSRAEEKLISESVNQYEIPSLLFVGGEPSLYVFAVNRILAGVHDLDGKNVRITTNGHFSGTKAAARKLLSQFLRITKVQLSYDSFHKKFLPLRMVGNLYETCLEMGIKFSVVLSIQSPLDLALITELRSVGDFPVGVQKILPTGAARANNVSMLYSSFNKEVLSSQCPNRGGLMYLCGEGFSVCCSSLIFNCRSGKYVHRTIRDHLRSRFYELIGTLKFEEIAAKLGVSLSEKELAPAMSSSCVMCEFIFKKAEAGYMKS